MNRVLVAMSGGVDSSVTAALLQQQGMQVEGITMKLTAGICCDIASAQAVCNHLRIPHRILEAQEEFSRTIIKTFISEYRMGRTPNPCIRCNDLVKFHFLLDYARSAGFDYLATGHYARIEHDPAAGLCVLRRGVDSAKDQSYFLYRLTRQQMASLLFPLGSLTKPAVRALARRLSLPAAERPESQEICFVPGDNYRSFLREHAPEALKPGKLVMTDGTVVGSHEGIAFFTVGQRRKLGVAAGERLYVVRIEPDSHRVVLGKKAALDTLEFLVSDLNLITTDLAVPMKAAVKIRYRSPFTPATIERLNDKTLRVRFEHGTPGVSPGQAAVFYNEETVVGGGVILPLP